MSKKLNIAAITRDLEGSAFFPTRKDPLEKPQETNPDVKVQDVPVPPSGSTPVPRTPVPPQAAAQQTGRRKIKQRHPFDIYEDQLETLRRIALEERIKGELGSMSAMVREAIDLYLATRKKKD